MADKKVFISYKSEDYENALWVRQVLESNGISCWMAPESIPGGSNYAVEIPQAIKGCSVFVVVVSTLCQESKWVPRELDQAINANKPIMPFMLENCELKDDFNFYLSNVQRYAAYEDKVKTIEKMILEIRSLMEVESKLSGGAENAAPAVNNDINVIKPPKEKKPKPEKAPMSAEKKAKVKKICVPVVAVFLAIAVAVSAIFIVKNNRKFDPNTMYRYVITASENSDISNFSKTQEIIKKRLDAVCKKYQFNAEGGKIEVIFEKELIGKEDPEAFFSKYVMATGKLGVYPNKDSARYYILDPNETEDVEKIEYKTGKLTNVDSKDIDKNKEYNYVTVKLSSDVKTELSQYNNPVLSLVTGSESTEDVKAYRDKDGVFYIVEGTKEDNYCKAIYDILKGEEVKTDLSLYTDLEAITKWETVKDDKPEDSKQCNLDAFKEDTVLFSYSSYDITTEGEVTDAVNIIKKRLNIIGNPYAIGLVYKDKKPYAIAVKTLPDRMNRAVANAITASSTNLKIRVGMQEVRLPYISSNGYAEYKGGKLTFVFDSNSLFTDDLDALDSVIKNNVGKSDYIYLNVSGALVGENLFCSKLDKNTKSNPLEFTDLVYNIEENNKDKADEKDEEWLGELIASIATEENEVRSISFDGDLYSSYGAKEDIKDMAWHANRSEEIVNKYKSKITELSKEAEIYYKQNTLYVNLNMPVNDEFADSVPKFGKEIYNIVDFEKNENLDALNIYFIDEDNNQDERARIFFNKEYGEPNSYSGNTNGKISANGIFAGGKVDLVKDEIVKQLKSDDFYSSRAKNSVFSIDNAWITTSLN